MISHYNAPSFSYRGWVYLPEVEHEDDDGIRKATHRFVNRADPSDIMICAEHLPYDWMTFPEVVEFINKMERVRS
tara:strand:+ start:454 stop:678 length:225 start_codon:yes stop_codon:yes gene_type:complete